MANGMPFGILSEKVPSGQAMVFSGDRLLE
jgi:hypothetical protein